MALALLLTPTVSEAQEAWRLDGGLIFDRFEQQVKHELGGAGGERLVEHTALGIGVIGTYRFWGPFSAGLFTRLDIGSRSAAQFEGTFDDSDAPNVTDAVGGAYQELWLGPILRAQWRTLFVEFGYGALGVRWDDARDDLQTTEGDASGALYVKPSIAWLAAVGGGVPMTDSLELVFRLEYRVRYYDRRGEPLKDSVVHGTQSITPFIGVCWNIGGVESATEEEPAEADSDSAEDTE